MSTLHPSPEGAKRYAHLTAEQFIREQHPLYRHYAIPEVVNITEQFTGHVISEERAVEIVQGIRSEKGYCPIECFNMPGFKGEE